MKAHLYNIYLRWPSDMACGRTFQTHLHKETTRRIANNNNNKVKMAKPIPDPPTFVVLIRAQKNIFYQAATAQITRAHTEISINSDGLCRKLKL